ncbi:hypothetical protein AAFP35_08340 [Gordonia sp. CPCC 206044]|uniref:hypothetical protein n=1 Tax=Gordonia sp. CPCC 206044 TaxID=3140793 RepID=UPI003AF3E56D
MTDNGAPLAMADANAAALTLGISIYAAAILVLIGLGINAVQHHRRERAITCAVIVGILVIAGVVVAIASSIG